MKRMFLIVAALLFFTVPSFAQDSLPSIQEIDSLTAKADEKVVVFENALHSAKPFIPEENFKNFSKAAEAAHLVIKTLQKDGPNAYRLVTLVMTLDDLVIDARLTMGFMLSQGLVSVSDGKRMQPGAAAAISALDDAATACYDMSELIGHATLRFISVEEMIIDKVTK